MKLSGFEQWSPKILSDKIGPLLRSLGVEAFDYRTADLRRELADGIDVYFDNVGGAITDGVFNNLNVHARIAICGQIALYNATKVEMGPRFLGALIVSRAKVQGLLVSDYASRWGAAMVEMAGWIREGKLKYREDIVEGFENMPKAFIGLFEGENTGKRIVKV